MRKINFKKSIATTMAMTLASLVYFGSLGASNPNQAFNIETGDCYYGEEDDESTKVSLEENLPSFTLTVISNGYSTEKIEKSLSDGTVSWLKQVLIEYGKYPMNPVSITDAGHYWTKCIGQPGYTADLSIGNEYPQNMIGYDYVNGKIPLYYVDGKISSNPADAGKPVDISMLAEVNFGSKNPLTEKYLYHPEEVVTADYVDERTIVNLSNVTVKDIPHPTGKALGSVAAGTVLKVTGITSNGWFRVDYNGQEAYIYYMFLA